jgi:hypothetical protein
MSSSVNSACSGSSSTCNTTIREVNVSIKCGDLELLTGTTVDFLSCFEVVADKSLVQSEEESEFGLFRCEFT